MDGFGTARSVSAPIVLKNLRRSGGRLVLFTRSHQSTEAARNGSPFLARFSFIPLLIAIIFLLDVLLDPLALVGGGVTRKSKEEI
jgi:hypothetical protein